MNYKELTDEELLKTMEFCIKKKECGKDCRLFNVQGCMWNMFNQSFQLIQRLQNKNKLLNISFKNECEEHKQFVKLAKQIDEQQKAENEWLTEELDFYKGANRGLESMNEQLIAETRKLLEEKEELQKQVDEAKECIELANKSLEVNNKRYEERLEQAVKDTAKEILYDIKYGFVFGYKEKNEVYQEGYDQALEDYDNKLEKLFKERYGVEVE